MKKIILGVVLGCVLILPTATNAGPIIRTGEKISVDSAQTLAGDFYGLAPTVTISGPAENDVYIAGGTVTVNAPVKQDLTIIGGTVQIHGEVGDDLRIIGGEVTLGDSVQGDVVVLGGVLTILSTASVEGDILFMGGDLTVEGPVDGAIHGTSENIRINSRVGGDISFHAANSFALGDKAEIQSTITYESPVDLVRAQNAVVTGEIHKKSQQLDASDGGLFAMFAFEASLLLFATLACYLIGRKYIREIVEESTMTPGMKGLVGLGIFLIIPFVSVIFLVSVVGILVGIVLVSLYVLSLILALVCACVLLGYYAQKALTKNTTITFMTAVYGVVLLLVLSLVPYIGGFVVFGFVMITLGGIGLSLYRALRV